MVIETSGLRNRLAVPRTASCRLGTKSNLKERDFAPMEGGGAIRLPATNLLARILLLLVEIP